MKFAFEMIRLSVRIREGFDRRATPLFRSAEDIENANDALKGLVFIE